MSHPSTPQAPRDTRAHARTRTFSRASSPTAASVVSPSASTRIASAHFAASTLLIFPLNFGWLWPMSDAW
jgi:hypothetical protein